MRKLITTSTPPEDFTLLAENTRTMELCGFTEQDGYQEVDDIPYGFMQRRLPYAYGDRHMRLEELLAAEMGYTGDILALNAVMCAVLPSMDADVARPIIRRMARKGNAELDFEAFTATPASHHTLHEGWGYYDPATGARGIWAVPTQECGDPGWAPGGAGYANWRMVPQLDDGGRPIWAKGVYADTGELWAHGGSLWKSLLAQKPSVWEPGTAPTVWEQVMEGNEHE